MDEPTLKSHFLLPQARRRIAKRRAGHRYEGSATHTPRAVAPGRDVSHARVYTDMCSRIPVSRGFEARRRPTQSCSRRELRGQRCKRGRLSSAVGATGRQSVRCTAAYANPRDVGAVWFRAQEVEDQNRGRSPNEWRFEQQEPFKTEAELRQAIEEWEQKERELFEMRVYWAFGAFAALLGLVIHRRASRWLGLAFLLTHSVQRTRPPCGVDRGFFLVLTV